jgi:hypothetical protein
VTSTQHVQRPELAEHEREFNRLMRLNPTPVAKGVIIKQVCMHVDRTITLQTGAVIKIECDYCDTFVLDPGWGPAPDLMPWIYAERLT